MFYVIGIFVVYNYGLLVLFGINVIHVEIFDKTFNIVF